MAGTFGKATGQSKGKYSGHHMGGFGDREFWAGKPRHRWPSIHPAGAALAFKMNGNGSRSASAFSGDGASNAEIFDESLISRPILSLPVDLHLQ